MLTALDLVNRLLNYFNIQDKPKGKVFTVVAFVANFYILYVALNNLRFAGYRWRGVLYMALFLVFLYFIFLNFLYYFTNKKFKYDISPKIEKALGGNAKVHKEAVEAFTKVDQPSSGVFAEDEMLPSSVTINHNQQLALDKLVDAMVHEGIVTTNYQGLDDDALARVATDTKGPLLAIGAPVPLPFFELRHTLDNRYVIIAGLNSLDYNEIATVTKVGISPIDRAAEQYSLAAASVTLTGGQQKELGRSGMQEYSEKYSINVRIAYKNPNESVQ
ncbi:hypothetical protein PQ472_02760 [Lacticaseibacillus pabuli]|uniref:Uncharacterized protein n=1 Tax=Lacticaseibacillus pabuli TaxID=3025672 RepID=A0ABY7WSL8_9LACO|nr:DUF6681 family protein [Lacticaseibacillus sp. KACC 23028]WDF83174.1 hypothetical protein PQ472_02760 [Lacticaseibacillus sp. KACC 23028]